MLIGLGGYAQSDKDTVADFCVEDHGFVKKYMSAPLETALLRVNPWVNINWDNWKPGVWQQEELWTKHGFVTFSHMRYADVHAAVGYDTSKNNFDVRDYLQKLGTEVGRNMFGENVWVDYTFNEVAQLMDAGKDVAVTGIRFQNELDRVREFGGTLVWVERQGFGPVNTHVSDNALGAKDFDVILPNDHDLETLALTVRSFIELGSLALVA